ncbi:hypothetical protein A2U01_0036173, partial [Trifolium medium]|nr:hypothetical protein [Trifolium medium]
RSKAAKLQKLKSFRGCEQQTLSKSVFGRSDFGVSEVHIRIDKEERRKYNVAITAIEAVVLLSGM